MSCLYDLREIKLLFVCLLFDILVKSGVLKTSQFWKRFILIFLRKVTKCRKSTSLNMLFAELGHYPLEIVIISRIIGFWNRLIHAEQSRIAYILYLVLKNNNKSDYKR